MKSRDKRLPTSRGYILTIMELDSKPTYTLANQKLLSNH